MSNQNRPGAAGVPVGNKCSSGRGSALMEALLEGQRRKRQGYPPLSSSSMVAHPGAAAAPSAAAAAAVVGSEQQRSWRRGSPEQTRAALQAFVPVEEWADFTTILIGALLMLMLLSCPTAPCAPCYLAPVFALARVYAFSPSSSLGVLAEDGLKSDHGTLCILSSCCCCL
eukprot:COSAG05_NODE_1194_length_5568_cov_26.075878_1_plen_170_part_00